MQCRLECSTERTHSSCLAIWWCLLPHLYMTHTHWGHGGVVVEGKVGQTFSKVNHFLNTHQSQQLNPHTLKKTCSKGSEHSSRHLLVITQPLISVSPAQINGGLSWGHKQGIFFYLFLFLTWSHDLSKQISRNIRNPRHCADNKRCDAYLRCLFCLGYK